MEIIVFVMLASEVIFNIIAVERKASTNPP